MSDRLDDLVQRTDEQIQQNRVVLETVRKMEAKQNYRKVTYETTYGEPMI
jgi:hypothetical protein